MAQTIADNGGGGDGGSVPAGSGSFGRFCLCARFKLAGGADTAPELLLQVWGCRCGGAGVGLQM
eukprot:365770-Chlamydomonas_euryale.AAC.2